MVNINTVYQRVLLLANKDQRGYITPEEFNSFASQAQLEIFESYFLKKFQANQAPGTMDDYADVSANIEEKLTFFDTTGTIIARGVSNLTYTSVSANAYTYPEDLYRLGVVTVNGRMADEVSHKDLTYINLSPLTKPTETQPVFTRHEGGVVVYPLDYQGDIALMYERKPRTPYWDYRFPTQEEATLLGVSITLPIFNDSDQAGSETRHFELHPSEEHELVYKILTLSGVAIKAADIAQFGGGKEGQLATTEA